MDNLTKNPGLQHVAEEILLNLKIVTLDKCLKVNESWKNIINTPSFWLRKCLRDGKLMKSKSAWEKVIQVMSHTNRKKISFFIIWKIFIVTDLAFYLQLFGQRKMDMPK